MASGSRDTIGIGTADRAEEADTRVANKAAGYVAPPQTYMSTHRHRHACSRASSTCHTRSQRRRERPDCHKSCTHTNQ